MQITEYYQAVGVVFGCWCLIQPIIDAFRPIPEQPTPPSTETVTTWERVEYKEEEIEVNHELNIEL